VAIVKRLEPAYHQASFCAVFLLNHHALLLPSFAFQFSISFGSILRKTGSTAPNRNISMVTGAVNYKFGGWW